MAAVAGIKAATATLVAATADTVTLSGGTRNAKAEIANQGTDVIYYRTDGTAPVAEADECGVVLASERLTIHLNDDGEVQLVSAGTPTYTVQVTGR